MKIKNARDNILGDFKWINPKDINSEKFGVLLKYDGRPGNASSSAS